MTAKVEADKRNEEAMLGTAPVAVQEADKEVRPGMRLCVCTLHCGQMQEGEHQVGKCPRHPQRVKACISADSLLSTAGQPAGAGDAAAVILR